MDKKVPSVLAIGIILILSIFIGGFFWMEKEGDIDQNTPLKYQVADKFNDIDKLCPKDTIEQYGEISKDKDILVYQTMCVFNINRDAWGNPNNWDTLNRFYVRNPEGTFNKKIYSVLNKTSADIIGFKKNKIQISGIAGNDSGVILDVFGNKVQLEKDEDTNSELGPISFSPNGKYLVTGNRIFSDMPNNLIINKKGVVYVKNVKTDKISSYTLSFSGFLGNLVAGWSEDGNSVYVTASQYGDMNSPATLAKIDILNNKVNEYDLKGFFPPVVVYADENVALLQDYDRKNINQINEIKIYKMDLNSGEKEVIATDKASFISLGSGIGTAKVGDEIYFTADFNNEGGQKQQLNKLDLKTGKISKFLDGSVYISAFSKTGWMALDTGGEYKVLFTNSGKEIFIGRGKKQGKPQPEYEEYISDIVGVITAD